jgi:ferredoxin
MSVEITFEPAGLSGLIAEGTYLIDAARRMGLRLPADCHERGECRSCVVSIVAGQSLLSPPTNAEKEMLAELIAREQRLACQTRIENSGEVVVRLIPASESKPEREDSQQPAGNDRVAARMGREALAMIKNFDAIVERSLSVGENMLDRFAQRVKSTRDREWEQKRPPEHRRQKES